MKTCPVCGGRVESKRIPRYHDKLMGIQGVILVDSVNRVVCTKCGERMIEIPDLDGLVKAVAVARAKMPRKLMGAEIRFLRKVLGWNAQTLARKLGVSPETLSRWENEKQPIAPMNEKLLRLMSILHLEEEAAGVPLDNKAVAEMEIDPLRRGVSELAFRYLAMPRARKTERCWSEIAAAA